MGLSEDIARLVLELDNKQFQQAGSSAVMLMGELSAAFGRGEITVAEFDNVLSHLGTDLGPFANQVFAAEGALEEFKRGGMEAAEAASKVSRAAKETGQGSSNLRQSIQGVSYALQDFASAGGGVAQKLQSISNNIPQILIGLGSAGAAVSAAFSIGVAVWQNWDTLIRIFQQKLPFERAAHDVEAMKRELTDAHEAMGKLEKNTSVTAGELEKYNALRARTAELERQISRETERQAILKRAEASVTEEQEKRGQEVQKATAGHYAEDTAQLKERLEAERRLIQAEDAARTRRRIQEAFTSGAPPEEANRTIAGITAEYQHRIAIQNQEDMGKRAEELYGQALSGQEEAVNRIKRLTEAAPGGGTYGLGTRIRQPERDKEAKVTRELTEQGAQIEEQALRELAQARKEQVDAARKASKDFQESQEAIAAEEERLAREVKDKAAETAKKARATEVKRIEDIAGKEAGGRYEVLAAQNLALQASGAPIARSEAQEAGLRRQGVAYALPSGEMARRLQGQMAEEFQARGAEPETAQQAAASIASKAQTDLSRRAATISGDTQQVMQQILQLTGQLTAEYGRQSQVLNAAMSEIQRQHQALRNMQPKQRHAQSQGGFG